MSELRKDPIVGRWVIVAEERGKRPSEFPPDDNAFRSMPCPFCSGNEYTTPPEILAYRREGDRNKPGWDLRVVPNKFPALQIEGELNPHGEGMFDVMHGIGAHEVIIETDHHEKGPADFGDEEFRRVLRAYRERITDLKRDMRFKYILIFKNHGSAAGATVAHAHSQLIATPVIPKTVMEEVQGVQLHYEMKERCIYCDIIRHEIKDANRIVLENDRYVAMTPFASRFPFETWILPKHHESHYENEPDGSLDKLSVLFREVLQRLGAALDDPPFNYVLHTAPINQKNDQLAYHWHIEIIPKLTKVAGFEWGSGFFINPTPPEHAAQFLRQVKIRNGHLSRTTELNR